MDISLLIKHNVLLQHIIVIVVRMLLQCTQQASRRITHVPLPRAYKSFNEGQLIKIHELTSLKREGTGTVKMPLAFWCVVPKHCKTGGKNHGRRRHGYVRALCRYRVSPDDPHETGQTWLPTISGREKLRLRCHHYTGCILICRNISYFPSLPGVFLILP